MSAAVEESGRRRIAVLLFDGVEELDAIGPWEVLSYWTSAHPDDGFSVFTLSAAASQAVRCARGLAVRADHTLPTAPPFDVLVYPGGPGTRAHLGDGDRLRWVGEQARRGTLMASVCTGSLVLAAAGVLRDRAATTHWYSLPDLSRLEPTVRPRPGTRFVDDGDVVTSAGVSAGIDMALHLVERLVSSERADEVARALEYERR